MNTPPEAISQRDAAKRLGVSTATIERWVRRGQLNTIRTGKNNGARRVLTDEAFHSAATRTSKIHHAGTVPAEKSVTPQNPSHSDEVPCSAVDTPTEPHNDAGDGFLSTPNSTRQADSVNSLAKSIMSTGAKPLTVLAAESITTNIPNVGEYEPPAIGLSPPAAQSPSPLSAHTSGERPRSASSRPSDADLVPLTRTSPGDPDAHTGAPATRAPSPGRLRACALTGVLVVTLAAAATLAIYRPWHQSPRPEISTGHAPVARGAPAKTIGGGPAKPRSSRAREARGGLAPSITAPAKTPKTNSQTPTRPPSPARTAAQPATAIREHRQHPITPCQSTGICVR